MRRIMDEKFKIVGEEQKTTVNKDYTDIPRWKDVLYRFTRNKGSVLGMIIILLVIVFALLGPFASPYGFDEVNTTYQNMPPRIPGIEKLGIFDGTRKGVNIYEQKGCEDQYFYFGTDTLGRDLWTRVCYGTRISLYIALVAVLIDMVIGITYGMVCGYFGGAVGYDSAKNCGGHKRNSTACGGNATACNSEARTVYHYAGTFDYKLDWYE